MSSTLSRSRPPTKQAKPRKRSRHNSGWVPNQHGAWAMLITPYVVGAGLRIRDQGWEWYLLPLFIAWMLGYFTFAATSLWLKAKRKPRFVRPMVTYGVLAGVFGLLALVLSTPVLLLWGVAYVPMTAVTLLLVAHRRERSTLSGLLTIAVAALMAVTAAYPAPASALQPGTSSSWWLAALTFAYFFGTVPYVKTLIRERGHRSWVIGSVAYHMACTLACAVAAIVGLLSWWWPVFFAALTLRAGLVPALGPMSGRTVSPKHAGFAEVGTTLIFAVIALTVL